MAAKPSSAKKPGPSVGLKDETKGDLLNKDSSQGPFLSANETEAKGPRLADLSITDTRASELREQLDTAHQDNSKLLIKIQELAADKGHLAHRIQHLEQQLLQYQQNGFDFLVKRLSYVSLT